MNLHIKHVVALLCVCSVSHYAFGTQALPENMIRGIAITPGGPFTLADNATVVTLDEAVNMNANWIYVNTYLSVLNGTSSKVFNGPQAPLNSVLKDFVGKAESKGLKVMLKPIVIPLDGTSWLQLHPTDPEEWFRSYTEILCGYCRLLPNLNALSIGLELTSLTIGGTYDEYWLQLISAVRNCSSSNLTLTYSSLFLLEWRAISFWDKLDWIGLDEYLPVADDSDPYPSVEEMASKISRYFDEVRSYVNAKNLTDKPVVITETGIYSYTNATFEPAYFPPGLKSCNGSYAGNFTTQELYFEATFNAISENTDLISGVFMYHFDNPSTSDYCRPCNIRSGDPISSHPVVIPDDDDSFFGDRFACGLTFRGKSALKVVMQAFGVA